MDSLGQMDSHERMENDMNQAEFRQLMSRYGTRFSSWPEVQRAEAEAFLTEHPAMKSWVKSEQSLDRALARLASEDEPSPTDLSRLREDILNQIPVASGSAGRTSSDIETLLDQFIDWIWPQSLTLGPLMRSATAAGLPLVIGAVLGATMMTPKSTVPEDEGEEVYLIALVDDAYTNLGQDEMENNL